MSPRALQADAGASTGAAEPCLEASGDDNPDRSDSADNTEEDSITEWSLSSLQEGEVFSDEYRECDMKAAKKGVVNLVLAGATLLGGVLALRSCEGFNRLEAVYVLTQIVTTIGYGDITLNGDKERLVMAFYILWLLVVVAYVLNVVVERVVNRNKERLKHRLSKVQHFLRNEHHFDFVRRIAPVSPAKAMHLESKCTWLGNSLQAGFVFACHIAFGVAFYSTYERCSCSYGHTAVAGCVEERCFETGGTQKNWASAFYMSIVTLTTVGFGDVTPLTLLGRFVGIPWMISGIISTGKFVEALQMCFVKEDKAAVSSEAVAHALFAKVDAENRQGVSKVEFVQFVLIQNGLVDQETIDRISAIYDTFDANKDNVVTFEEIRSFQRAYAHAHHH